MNKTVLVVGGLIIVGIIGYVLLVGFPERVTVDNSRTDTSEDTTSPVVDVSDSVEDEQTEEDEPTDPEDSSRTVIGRSVEDLPITAYHYGEGDIEVIFVGGIHGGYGWNTVLVAYELMDYLEDNEDAIPEGVRVSVIPTLNPDGLEEIVSADDRFTPEEVPSNVEDTIAGRFNARDVDLNRNFDCDWQERGTWQSRSVSGGSEAFSEPESQAFRDYIEESEPDAVVVWYAAAGGVFASNCHGDVLPKTLEMTNIYAEASGYKAYEEFDFYEVTGDMVNWLAKEGYPAISVLLTNHQDVEWNKNKRGVDALLKYLAE